MMRRCVACVGIAVLLCAVPSPAGQPADEAVSGQEMAAEASRPSVQTFTMAETAEDTVVTTWHSGRCGCSVCQG